MQEFKSYDKVFVKNKKFLKKQFFYISMKN